MTDPVTTALKTAAAGAVSTASSAVGTEARGVAAAIAASPRKSVLVAFVIGAVFGVVILLSLGGCSAPGAADPYAGAPVQVQSGGGDAGQ